VLAEACELEHALCCSYLYAAFSIKKDIHEGITWEQQQQTRLWASRLYHVAAQEMLHLSQAWNIMNAVGGAPYYGRPEFPQPAKHFPLNVPLSLRKFDVSTMERFLVYEKPESAHFEESSFSRLKLWPIEEEFKYETVGELYGEVASIIKNSNEDNLFIGENDLQADQKLIDFYDIIHVSDKETAIHGIDLITEQGEGTELDREDSHYGVYLDIHRQLKLSSFDPAVNVADNPFVISTPLGAFVNSNDSFAENGILRTRITYEPAIYCIDLFNDIYVIMLQALAHVFNSDKSFPEKKMLISKIAIELMITVIKPLGEGICRIPSGIQDLNAGPSFEISKHIDFPQNTLKAIIVFTERLEILHQRGLNLLEIAKTESSFSQIKSAVLNIGRLSKQLTHCETK